MQQRCHWFVSVDFSGKKTLSFMNSFAQIETWRRGILGIYIPNFQTEFLKCKAWFSTGCLNSTRCFCQNLPSAWSSSHLSKLWTWAISSGGSLVDLYPPVRVASRKLWLFFWNIRTSYPPWVRGGSSKFATDGARFSEFIIGSFLQMWPTNPLFLAKVIFIGDALLSVRCHGWTPRDFSMNWHKHSRLL